MAPTAWVLSKVQIVSRQELDLDLMLPRKARLVRAFLF
jgi:hypothetical protein